MNISVIIPTHNRIQKLNRALQSVFKQSCMPIEVIVVDDGSIPAVGGEIFEGAPDCLKTKLLRNKTSKGANNARNRGIKEAEGDWIAFLDDDDEFMSNKIEELLKCLEIGREEIDLIYHPAIIQMVNENVSYETSPRNFGSEDDIFTHLLARNYIGGTPMVVVKKKELLDLGMFDEKLESLQDYELWIRFAKKNLNFHFLNTALTKCYYITQKKSISKSIDRYFKSINYIENKYNFFYQQLSEKMLLEHQAQNYDREIHKAYLNKNYFRSIYLNYKAFLKLGKFKYLLRILVSLLGSTLIFKLRAF